tara:strand:+ start:471 stop:614 length:144 start_codon:yes stop_codon:yes gene_type:complete
MKREREGGDIIGVCGVGEKITIVHKKLKNLRIINSIHNLDLKSKVIF